MGQNFIACDREQSFLMPPDVREWLPEDHFAWFVIDAVAAMEELYPDVVDAPEEQGGVPSRLIKTDRREAAKEGTPWTMFAGSPPGRTRTGSRSRSTSSRARARV